MNNFKASPDPFAQKYDYQHALHYLKKHRTGLSRKLSNWREQQIAKLALKAAGNPLKILDIPCGAGRFWPVLATNKQREIIAADNSEHMLEVAKKYSYQEIRSQISLLHTSAYHIQLPDNAVDNIFCMRLIHHIGNPNDRLKILKEFHRVTNNTVCVSLWVDGNYKARRRKKQEDKKKFKSKTYQNRFVIPRNQIENEFTNAGFEIIGKHNLVKYYSMWRIYTLRKIPSR